MGRFQKGEAKHISGSPEAEVLRATPLTWKLQLQDPQMILYARYMRS